MELLERWHPRGPESLCKLMREDSKIEVARAGISSSQGIAYPIPGKAKGMSSWMVLALKEQQALQGARPAARDRQRCHAG